MASRCKSARPADFLRNLPSRVCVVLNRYLGRLASCTVLTTSVLSLMIYFPRPEHQIRLDLDRLLIYPWPGAALIVREVRSGDPIEKPSRQGTRILYSVRLSCVSSWDM